MGKGFGLCTNVYLMYLCEMTRAKQHIHKYMVLQCSKLVYFKVPSVSLGQDSKSSSFEEFWQDPKCRRPRFLAFSTILAFQWRKISHILFKYIKYIFPLVLLLRRYTIIFLFKILSSHAFTYLKSKNV